MIAKYLQCPICGGKMDKGENGIGFVCYACGNATASFSQQKTDRNISRLTDVVRALTRAVSFMALCICIAIIVSMLR